MGLLTAEKATRQQRMCRSNKVEFSSNHCCRGKAIIITYSECFSVACSAHARVCGLSGSTTFFFTLEYKRQFMGKNVMKHKICILISPTNFPEIFLILRRTERDVIT